MVALNLEIRVLSVLMRVQYLPLIDKSRGSVNNSVVLSQLVKW